MVIVSVCSMFLVIQVGLNKDEKAKATAKPDPPSPAGYAYEPMPVLGSEKARPSVPVLEEVV